MRDSDLQGPGGRAWRVTIEVQEGHASLGLWLVNAPGAHPFWSWWAINIVHLRPLEGFPPAKKHYPEAEYEFLIVAINPEECPEPDVDQQGGWPTLTPVDVCEQFDGVIDVEATRICELAAQAIVNGTVSPDQDHRPIWKQLIAGTLAHFRQGKHTIN